MKSTISHSPLFLCAIVARSSDTSVAVVNEKGELLYRFIGKSIDQSKVGEAKALTNGKDIRNQLIDELERMPDFVFVTDASDGGNEECSSVYPIAKQLFDGKMEVRSCHYTSLIAIADETVPMAMMEAGVETKAWGIDQEGRFVTTGGWGATLGNEGSATHLTVEALKAVIRANDGMARRTVLTQRVKQYFQVEDFRQLPSILASTSTDPNWIAGFSAEVEQASEEGDIASIMLLGETIEWLYRLSQSIIRKCGAKQLCLSGDLFQSSKVIRERLSERFNNSGVDIYISSLTLEQSALIAAFKMASLSPEHSLFANWQTQFAEEIHA